MVEMMMVGVVTFPMHESAIRTEIDNNVNRINIPFQMLDLSIDSTHTY